MTRAASRTLPAGIVAVSSPRNAQSVSVTTATTSRPRADVLVSVTTKCAGANAARPAKPMSKSGSTFRMVVVTCTCPAARTPRLFTYVRSQTVATAIKPAVAGLRTSVGKNGSR